MNHQQLLMVFPLKPPFSYGFPMVFPLKPPFSYGFPNGFPIKTSMFLWFSHGSLHYCWFIPPSAEHPTHKKAAICRTFDLGPPESTPLMRRPTVDRPLK